MDYQDGGTHPNAFLQELRYAYLSYRDLEKSAATPAHRRFFACRANMVRASFRTDPDLEYWTQEAAYAAECLINGKYFPSGLYSN